MHNLLFLKFFSSSSCFPMTLLIFYLTMSLHDHFDLLFGFGTRFRRFNFRRCRYALFDAGLCGMLRLGALSFS